MRGKSTWTGRYKLTYDSIEQFGPDNYVEGRVERYFDSAEEALHEFEIVAERASEVSADELNAGTTEVAKNIRLTPAGRP